jgi:thiosulfate/3-mercaptopyruvate sulfurtransferase
MKNIVRILVSSIVILCLGFTSAQAQDVISAKELAKIYKSKDVVVVSTRKATDYKKVHIAGAVHVKHMDLYKDGPVKSMLKSPADIAKILGEKGISADKKIVIYDGGTGKYSGRLYWILKYLGAKDVVLLDGHLKAWRAARKPVTKNPTKITPVTFTPQVNKAILATMADVQKAIADKNTLIVDVRSEAEYKGTKEDVKVKKGHIASAINIEFKEVMNARAQIKPAEELKALFAAKGITPDKNIILYCESSVRAGVVYMVLTSGLGYKNVKVYDGAFFEWESKASNKIEL